MAVTTAAHCLPLSSFSPLSMALYASEFYPARKIWLESGLPESLLKELLVSDNPDPAVDSSFKLGAVAQTTIGLSGLSAAYFHFLNTGASQIVTVDPRHAIVEFKSENYWLLNGEKPVGALFDGLAGLYKTEDGFVRIHTNFPHHKQGILDLLQCEPTRKAIQAALLQWNGQEFEDETARRKLVATKARTFEEWDKHPQAIAIRTTPPVQIMKVGEAPKRQPHRLAGSPLSGIRVLDLTRVLAGPVAGRTLAAHGADVLFITSPQLPDLPYLDRDTSRGKRTTQLNLNEKADRETLRDLAKEADVFLQAYRPGGLHEKGFGVRELVGARPGLVYASLRAYGWDGPWTDRRGFDSLVQNVTGFSFAEALAYGSYNGGSDDVLSPKPLPCQAIDHAAGYLLAFGIIAALSKTVTVSDRLTVKRSALFAHAQEGGSWEVRVSLAGVAQWIRHLGQLEPQVAFGMGSSLPSTVLPWPEDLDKFSVKIKQVHRNSEKKDEDRSVMALRHAAKLSLTPVREGEAPSSLNVHEAEWLHRE